MRKGLAKNLSYTIVSNLLSLIVSVTITLIVPKVVGVETYGYWTLYLFYATFVGFAHFGLLDGIYLKYGGFDPEDLDATLLRRQFYGLAILQFCVAGILSVYSIFFVDDRQKTIVLIGISIALILANIQTFFSYVLQVTSQFDKNAQMIMSQLTIYAGGLIWVATFGSRQLDHMILADIAGRGTAVLLGFYFCRDIFMRHNETTASATKEFFLNIGIGSSLLIANLASTLIIGSIRFEIEHVWDVSTFGKVSLTLSLSNFVMVFLTAVGLVLFPLLRRTAPARLPAIFFSLRSLLMALTFTALFAYFILRPILDLWLPRYSESLEYMALVFPIIIFEGRMSLLINPYMKALRKERMLLACNVAGMLVGIILAKIFGSWLHNLDMIIVSIVLALAFRCIITEAILVKHLEVSVTFDIFLELALTAVFMVTGWFLPIYIAAGVYAVVLIAYILYKRQDIAEAVKIIGIKRTRTKAKERGPKS